MCIWETIYWISVLSNTTCNCQSLISWKGYNSKGKNCYNWKAMRESNVIIKNEQIRSNSSESWKAVSVSTVKGAITADSGWRGQALGTELCPNSEPRPHYGGRHTRQIAPEREDEISWRTSEAAVHQPRKRRKLWGKSQFFLCVRQTVKCSRQALSCSISTVLWSRMRSLCGELSSLVPSPILDSQLHTGAPGSRVGRGTQILLNSSAKTCDSSRQKGKQAGALERRHKEKQTSPKHCFSLYASIIRRNWKYRVTLKIPVNVNKQRSPPENSLPTSH